MLCNSTIDHRAVVAGISFNSLFVGMCFAMVSHATEIICREEFQFPFRRDVLCNSRSSIRCVRSSTRFNSLFVGMCFAIRGPRIISCFEGDVSIPFSSGCALQCVGISRSVLSSSPFQFPFRRDVLCNSFIYVNPKSVSKFQFPFRRDVLCNGVVCG